MAAQQLGKMQEFEPEHIKEFKAKLQVREDAKVNSLSPDQSQLMKSWTDWSEVECSRKSPQATGLPSL